MISGNLEYLMSSLPYLSFRNTEEERLQVSTILQKYAQKPGEPESLVDILDQEATKYLSPNKAALFRKIALETVYQPDFRESSHSVLADFAHFLYRQKKDIVRLREARRAGTEQMIKDLDWPLEAGDPLQEEIRLMQQQWDELDKLSIGHYADFGALLIYKLQLLILERWWSFDQEQGMHLFLQTTERS